MWSVFFVFLSYLDRNFVKGEFLSSLDAEKESKELFYMLNNTLCARTSFAGQYHLHQVTDGVEEVRSVHDSQGRLVDCSVIRNEMQVKSFMHVCRIGLRDQKSNSDLKRSLTGVSEAKAGCNKLKSRNVIVRTKQPKEGNSDAADINTLRRSKRGFTYPGTLWCGAGNIAAHYDQLGEFAETDKCCRVHDHCPYVIHAFSSNYGYTNFKWHSLSHCDCDNALKECLRLVNDTSSRVVGQAFFNVIEVPCFEFSYEEQCVERHWYGMCKRYDKVPVAAIRESIPYDFGGIDVIDVLTIAPPKTKGSDESTTQSTLLESKTTAPEEPSLTNVVTAAEDFIKVLATVSTSQSSSTEVRKGETQSERKKKKNSGKKKKENKKRRGKGKGRKKSRKPDAVLKVDEGGSSAPSTSQTEEVMGKNMFVEGHAKIETLRTKVDNFMNSELDTVGNSPLSNKMMRDDPPRTVNESQEVVSTPASTKKEEILERVNNTEPIAHTTCDTAIIPKQRQRSQKKKTRKTIADTKSSPSAGPGLPTSMTESPIMAVRKEKPLSTEHKEERGPVVGTFATQNTPIVRTKRPNSRQREGKKKMKKIFTPSTEPSPDLTSGDSQLLPGSDTRGVTVEAARVLERLGLDRLENLESLVTSSSAHVGNPKNKLQSLQGAIVRRTFEEEHSNPSNERRVIKICYEVILPPETDQTMNTEIPTAPTFTPAQTNTTSTVTRTPRTTKMKRTRERGNGEKKRKN
ncbi:Group 3 secretory phospholipase A2 [Triplophysa tibetana]|uniref:phospholipase A2 n=1 Tax=Triplophysa tibetana TaxID=1572043 RepID=A0A5A9MUT1_9TELE|nr:Group 3 secretory phospholipase A2 [Triplophysa tibetana]